MPPSNRMRLVLVILHAGSLMRGAGPLAGRDVALLPALLSYGAAAVSGGGSVSVLIPATRNEARSPCRSACYRRPMPRSKVPRVEGIAKGATEEPEIRFRDLWVLKGQLWREIGSHRTILHWKGADVENVPPTSLGVLSHRAACSLDAASAARQIASAVVRPSART